MGIDLTSFSVKPNNNAITLNWSVATDEDISGFNIYRRIAIPTSISTVGEIAQSPLQTEDNTRWTKVNTSLITGSNPYSYTDSDIEPNTTYEYKLEAVVSDKNETLGTTECTAGKGVPDSFDIVSIYPCPTSSIINLDVNIPVSSYIDIAIYDITGRKVATVTSGLYNPGEYTLISDITGLTNGVYIVKMTTDGFNASKRFVIAR
ncbi:MAG: T9SS type A sorting domain-containing protein [bacterium]